MNAKIVFVNTTSRLVAARQDEDKYIVFEYLGTDIFQVGEQVECKRIKRGPELCWRVDANVHTKINILSPGMDFVKAKLVVAPWQDASIEDLAV